MGVASGALSPALRAERDLRVTGEPAGSATGRPIVSLLLSLPASAEDRHTGAGKWTLCVLLLGLDFILIGLGWLFEGSTTLVHARTTFNYHILYFQILHTSHHIIISLSPSDVTINLDRSR